MLFFTLTRGEDYVNQGQNHYEEQQLQRSISALKRRAAAMSFVITRAPASS
jgi:transposase